MIDSSYSRDTREPYQPLSQFEAVVIKVASPEVIRSWRSEEHTSELQSLGLDVQTVKRSENPSK